MTANATKRSYPKSQHIILLEGIFVTWQMKAFPSEMLYRVRYPESSSWKALMLDGFVTGWSTQQLAYFDDGKLHDFLLLHVIDTGFDSFTVHLLALEWDEEMDIAYRRAVIMLSCGPDFLRRSRPHFRKINLG